MSLVLNTNQGDTSYLLSNDMIGVYPDFDEQLLVVPYTGTAIRAVNSTITSQTQNHTIGSSKIFEVNGTGCDFVSKRIAKDKYLGNQSGGGVGTTDNVILGIKQDGPMPSMSYTDTTVGQRMVLLKKFNAGNIIGKHVIVNLPFMYYSGRYYSNSRYNFGENVQGTFGLQVKLGLLHSDGTITYIGTIVDDVKTYSEWTSVSTAKLNVSSGRYNFFDFSSQGVETIDGDFIVVDYIFTIQNLTIKVSSGNVNQTYYLGCQIYHGQDGNADLAVNTRPFQISMD